jgi:aryl-alcohol dehydrogenase-like predicted oxidoreductase
MKYNPLGNSNLRIAEFSLGTSIYGEDSAKGVSKKNALDLIHLYLDFGGNHIDTADVYGNGIAEEIIGKAIKNKRDQVVLSSKVGFSYQRQIHSQGLSPAHIIQSVENSLRRLQTEYIDMYYLHLWDTDIQIEASLEVMEGLVSSGKILGIGISNFKAWQLMKCLQISDLHSWPRVVSAQYQYSLLKRDIEYEFPDFLLNEKIGLVVWGALGGGFLSGKYNPLENPTSGRLASAYPQAEYSWERRNTAQNWKILKTIAEIAQQRKATCTQIALAWLNNQNFVTSILLGARNRNQLQENLSAVEIDLDEDEIKSLSDISCLPELYPYHFVRQFGRQHGG